MEKKGKTRRKTGRIMVVVVGGDSMLHSDPTPRVSSHHQYLSSFQNNYFKKKNVLFTVMLDTLKKVSQPKAGTTILYQEQPKLFRTMTRKCR